MRKSNGLVYGIGINDSDKAVTEVVNGKRQKTVYYEKWKSILQRAYDKNFHDRRPTYKDVTVCEEWLTFSNFKRWMETQDFEGKELDKDLLIPNNREYGPDACCFIPRRLNVALISNPRTSKYDTGVCFIEKKQKYVAQIGINGVAKTVKLCDTAEEAHKAYCKAKAEYLETFKDGESQKIQDGLDRHIRILTEKAK